MAATPNTSATSYLSVTELKKRKDWRFFADFCSDTNVRLTENALATDGNLAAILLDASGMLEMACLAGNAYQPADLAAMVANGGAGAAAIYRILADLAEGLAVERRPDRNRPIPPCFERAMEQLKLLRSGERIIAFEETQDAGQVQHYVMTAEDDAARGGIVSDARRFFGTRSKDRQTFGG